MKHNQIHKLHKWKSFYLSDFICVNKHLDSSFFQLCSFKGNALITVEVPNKEENIKQNWFLLLSTFPTSVISHHGDYLLEWWSSSQQGGIKGAFYTPLFSVRPAVRPSPYLHGSLFLSEIGSFSILLVPSSARL